MTGSDPAKTGNMVGRYLRRYRRSVNSGESPKKDYLAAKDQAARVGKKIEKRQSSNPDYDGEYGEGVEDGKGNSFAAVYGDYDQAFKYEMPPKNAPNPTDVKRRAKGNRPYRQRASTELVRGSRLALAEAVLDEYLSPKGYASKLGGSMKKFIRAGKPIEKAIHRKFPKTDADYYEGRGGGVGMTGTEDSRKEDFEDAQKLVQRRAGRVAKVEKGRGRFGMLGKPTKLSRRGFDDQNMPNNPAQKPKPSFDQGSRNVGSRGRRKGRTTIQGIKDLFSGRKDPNYDGGY